LYPDYAELYPQIEMRLKLLISLLILALSADNAVAIAMCPSYCASSKTKTEAADHYHHGTPNHKNSHVHGNGMRCPECPSTSEMSLTSGCGNSVRDQAIKEGSASQDESRESALSYISTISTNAPQPSDNSERQLRLDTSGNFRSSPPSAALRI